jgi:hypothetical protein
VLSDLDAPNDSKAAGWCLLGSEVSSSRSTGKQFESARFLLRQTDCSPKMAGLLNIFTLLTFS